MTETACPTCGETFERLSMHWYYSDECGYPDIEGDVYDIITGILLGDAHIQKPSSNGVLEVKMTNRVFVDHIDEILGIVSCGTRNGATPEKKKTNYARNVGGGDEYEFSQMYNLHTHTHPVFGEMRDNWYGKGEKRFPDDIELTPMVAKYWYSCDGGLQVRSDCRPRAQITALNEADRPEFVISMFDDAPASPNFSTDRLYFSVDETPKFLEWMGEPTPGFEYKWDLEQ